MDCRRSITRSSTLRIFATARRATSSFFVWKPTIRSSSRRRHGRFLKASHRFRSWRWSINPMKKIRAHSARALMLSAAAALMFIAGCRQDMQDQPKMIPQRESQFFADGRSVRPQVEHTVARGQLREDEYFYTGLVNGKEQDALPFAATLAVLERGQERYNIYCTPCHSRVGNGDGMIVQRGYRPAGDFHTDRLRNAPLGHFFNVMTNGYGAMPDYAAQLTVEDRWAVVAYIRALQLSQDAKPGDMAAGQHVQDLHDIAKDEGVPPGFADPW